MTIPPPVVRLSVAILVRDAAEPLRRTLTAVGALADEILIIDTGSTDGTRQLAQQFQTRILDFPWQDDFAAARNFGQQQASGDWVLWLDAGETLSEDDARGLRTFVQTMANRQYAYVLLIRVPATGSTHMDEQVGRVRLLPHLPGITFTGRVRETPEPSLAAAGLTLAGAPFLIRRDGGEGNAQRKKERAIRNLRLAERELTERGPSSRLWNCLGDALQSLGDYPRATECFRQGLSLAGHGAPEMLEAYYGLWTCFERTETSRESQLPLGIEALEVFPLDAQLLCTVGGFLRQQDKIQLATQCYANAYRYGQVQPLVWHVTEIRDLAAVCYCALLQRQQRADEAYEFLAAALHQRPESPRLRRWLIEQYPESELAHAVLRVWQMAEPHNPEAAHWLAHLAHPKSHPSADSGFQLDLPGTALPSGVFPLSSAAVPPAAHV